MTSSTFSVGSYRTNCRGVLIIVRISVSWWFCLQTSSNYIYRLYACSHHEDRALVTMSIDLLWRPRNIPSTCNRTASHTNESYRLSLQAWKSCFVGSGNPFKVDAFDFGDCFAEVLQATPQAWTPCGPRVNARLQCQGCVEARCSISWMFLVFTWTGIHVYISTCLYLYIILVVQQHNTDMRWYTRTKK